MAKSKSHTTLPIFRFMVEWGNQVEAVFSECSGLNVEVDVFKYEEGGENNFVHQLPGRVKWSNITLKRGMTSSIELWKWFQKTMPGTGGATKIDKRSITIILYDETHKNNMRWNVSDAYPIKWEGPSMKVDGAAVAIETLVLAHNGFELEYQGG